MTLPPYLSSIRVYYEKNIKYFEVYENLFLFPWLSMYFVEKTLEIRKAIDFLYRRAEKLWITSNPFECEP